jgi:hypothetical protein
MAKKWVIALSLFNLAQADHPMTSKHEKLLEHMRRARAGWKRGDLLSLYEGFGFVISSGSKHDIIKHPKYPLLRTTLPRHNYLARGYVEFAIKMIDQLKQLQESDNERAAEN